MKIETKLSINDECYFIMANVVCRAKITGIKISIGNDAYPYVTYEIDKNPAGSKYTLTGFNDSEVFATKAELLASL